jgi:hypothetical protein
MNPNQGRYSSKEMASSSKKQVTVNREVGTGVRSDDTTMAEKRGECFAQSAHKHVLKQDKGFGEVRPTVEEHQTDRGLKTLSSDSRKAPLPEQGVKLDIDTCMPRNNEHIIVGDRENTVT